MGGGGGGGRGRGQGGCERRIEVFVKIQKKNFFGGSGVGGGGGGVGLGGQSGCERKTEVFFRGGGGWVGGVRVDVNQGLKFFGKFKKKIGGGGGRVGPWGVRVGGSGWM